MRKTFDAQLEDLNVLLIEMGAQIELALKGCIEALIDRDAEKAKEVVEIEKLTDMKEREIEDHCYRLILQQQPVARDLRTISSALKIITDMERIGDQAADIATLTLKTKSKMIDKDFADLKKMAEETSKMITAAIDSFVQKNEEKARTVIDNDDIVDNLFELVREDTVKYIQSDKAKAEKALNYFMIAKYLERIGDHATNIAEWVIYAITGHHAIEFPTELTEAAREEKLRAKEQEMFNEILGEKK
ncbi:phosphate signaling complex protein PhoU [Criibacterium bergeronii]|uniref:Phosphate-specific transport system accessory protein PhoU n=1 Tax=Criibacterium bergeronii TaxID=1871336 RepID=A0A371IIV9_9FIRM|nr:phosphate signaling complex protein PhoU [Criibacterium bergeronii]RDY20416.1 phosphate transport system regulatory protein PhoU [Criibacterium bergeronii]TRW25409.1 phosphate signaling complex protein PhoU [Criibacterium bergeronii]